MTDGASPELQPSEPDYQWPAPDPRLVKKLSAFRRQLPEPDEGSPGHLVRLYRTVSRFDPLIPQVGKGYRSLVTSYEQATDLIAEDTQAATGTDFMFFANQEAMVHGAPGEKLSYAHRPDTNPLVVFSTSAYRSAEFGFGSGYTLEAWVPVSVVFDHNAARRKAGLPKPYEVENRVYLYGPLNPQWIVGVTSRDAEQAKLQDMRTIDVVRGDSMGYRKFDIDEWRELWGQMQTKIGVITLLREFPDRLYGEYLPWDLYGTCWEFLKHPSPDTLAKVEVPWIRPALKRAVLFDGGGEKGEVTFVPGAVPITKAKSLEDLKKTLDVYRHENLKLGELDPEDVWNQIERYVRREMPLEDIKDPIVRERVMWLQLNALYEDKTLSL